jgi:hypothetical protein
VVSPDTRAIHRRATAYEVLAGLALATVLGTVAVVRTVDWGRLVAAAPLTVASPSGWLVAAAVVITVAVAVGVVATNRKETVR